MSSRSTPLAFLLIGALVATVRSVDPTFRTCTVVTGVGHALRIVKVQVESDTRVLRDGKPIPLSELAPGTIVRLDFRDEAGRKRCVSIEAREPEAAP